MTIFITRNDPDLERFFPDKNLLVNTITFGYKSLEGPVGIDLNPSAEEFISFFLSKKDLLWQRSTNSFIQMPFKFKDLIQNCTFVIHNPRDELLDLANYHKEFQRLVKLNELRLRYGKAEEEIKRSIFFGFWDNVKRFISAQDIKLVLEQSDFLSLWRFNEFGFHFSIVDNFGKAQNILDSIPFEIKEVKDIRGMPVW